jgi:hypothetical protein
LLRSIVGRPDERRKAPPRQLYEMVRLYTRRGIGPRYYLSSGLNGAGIPTSEVLGHVNEGEYKRFVRTLNPPADRTPLNSKVEQKRRLIEAGVSTPAPIYASERTDAAALAGALRGAVGKDVAVKPVSSFGGSGFHRFAVAADGEGIRLDDRDASISLSSAELAAAMPGGLIVEPYVRQHPWYAGLNASSVNTWRIWVIDRGGRIETILAYLRIGRAGSRVDNMTQGGLFAPLWSDGRLGPAQDGSLSRRRFAAHPDSSQPIAGSRPPLVEEAKQLAERALGAMKGLRFAGVDVAISQNGPVVIEVNPEPDRAGAARVALPFKSWLAERGIAV